MRSGSEGGSARALPLSMISPAALGKGAPVVLATHGDRFKQRQGNLEYRLSALSKNEQRRKKKK